MGRVFAWDAVEAGRIPRIDDFEDILDLARNKLANEPSIIAALFFGSVHRGDSNKRSDIDIAVHYDVEAESAALNAFHWLDVKAAARNVSINYTTCDTVLAPTGLHNLGLAFRQHLEESLRSGGCIKGDLVSHLASTISVQDEIRNYLRERTYKTQSGLAQSATYNEARRLLFLQKALETPLHMARKMLIYEDKLQGDSKQAVADAYRLTMPKELVLQFNALMELDAWYSKELDLQDGRPKRVMYVQALGHLMSQLPKTLAFLRANAVRLDGPR